MKSSALLSRLSSLVIGFTLILSCTRTQAAISLKAVTSGLSAPIGIASANDGSNRLFIIEQGGKIRIVANGILTRTPFLDISSRIVSGGELGLLGLAFHPSYSTNGRFFVNYTRNGANGLETVIAEYAVSDTDPNLASSRSEKILLTFRQPFENHNGGMIAFGPDGYLYIGTGDGGAGGDPQGNGQNLGTLLGKILRIDVDSAVPYAIPPSNPFTNRLAPAVRSEIWAYGLRNPWRFSFDRLTGRLFAGDVGQDLWEEVDIIVKGGNYGWNTMEGNHCYSPEQNCNTTGLTLPISEYDHNTGSSITGGYVYRGTDVPSLSGKYVFGDFGSGVVWALSEVATGEWQREQLLKTGNISSFGEDEHGELYLADYSGTIRQFVETGTSQPTINAGGIVSAASYLPGPIAPGEIITIFGTSIGPTTAEYTRLNSSGLLDSFLANTRVLFDGIAAPLFYVQANQINAQVPYEVTGNARTSIQVQYNNVFTTPIGVPIAASAPSLFAILGGIGQGALLNQDATPNSSSNPAARGSVVVLYATGEGKTNPSSVSGKLSSPPYPAPSLPVSVTIAGVPSDIIFVGSAPGFTGLLQINTRVPLSITAGNHLPVQLTVGGTTSQAGITMAVK